MITPTVVETAVDLQHVSSEMEEQFTRIPPLTISTLVREPKESIEDSVEQE
jgi:hypothetical protein